MTISKFNTNIAMHSARVNITDFPTKHNWNKSKISTIDFSTEKYFNEGKFLIMYSNKVIPRYIAPRFNAHLHVSLFFFVSPKN